MANKDNIFRLTKYQMEVLFFKCTEGATHAEIAEKLEREVNTVQHHMSNIYKTLEISKPGKSKEEMDSELKNEICPEIRKMFHSIEDVRIWAPTKRRPSESKQEKPEGETEEPEKKGEAEASYQLPPSVERILRQNEIQPPQEQPPPEIVGPPPPGIPRTNWRRIILWTIIVLIIFFVWRNYPQISAMLQAPANTPVQSSPTHPLPPTKQAAVPASTATATVTVTVTLTPTVPATASLVPTPTPIEIVTQVSVKDGMALVYVPAGEFKMGSSRADDPETLEEELPQHIVFLDEYWIDQTEVTNAQYAMCVADHEACTPPKDNISLTRSSYYDNPQYANFPVIYVTWGQAEAYCTWAGRHLPTEAEWEKAARGPDGLIYPWGNTFDGTLANYCDINCPNPWKDTRFDDGYTDTSPVGEYPAGASLYGVFEMAGNVYEWVADWYGPYSRLDQENPTGPASGTEHIIRGGAWGDDFAHVRTAVRSHINDPDFKENFIGFRCAR